MKEATKINFTITYFDGSTKETIVTKEDCKRGEDFNTLTELLSEFVYTKKGE